jgi:hypothetical protein
MPGSENSASNEARPAALPFRARGIVLGFLLCVPASYVWPNAPSSAYFSILVAPIAALLAMILANVPLRRWWPAAALNQSDLILIYAMTAVAAATGGEWLDALHPLIHMIPYHRETDPVVAKYFVPHIPDWLAFKDMEPVRDIAGGGHSVAYTASKLPLFFPKYLMMGLMVISGCLAMLCINSLMRGAWTQREKLSFPLIQLPVALAEKGGAGPIWKSRYLWIAFGVMFAIDLLNGMNYLFPSVPRVPVKDWIFLDAMFKDPPWSNIGEFRLSLYPFMAAIAIFMPSDLTLSIVVFYLLRKATHVVLAANGIPQETFSGTFVAPGPPYIDEQSWGGILALFLGAMWVSKGYLREVWADIRSGRRAEDGGLPHRWAFFGLLACFAVLVAFGVAGQLPIAYLVPYVALFLIFSIVLTRIRAQLGPPTHEFAFLGPNSVMNRVVGNRWMNDRQSVWINAVFIWMNRIYRAHPMPNQLEAMKMANQERLNQGTLAACLVGATVVGFFLSMLFLHSNAYYLGNPLRSGDTLWYFNSFNNNRHGTDFVGILMTAFGFAMVAGLDWIRFQFPGFPLHPAGYVLSMNYGVDKYWFGLFLAMLVRNFVQRYYGLRGYDKLRHVAFGILIAEYAAETIWMTMAMATHQSTYTISFDVRSLGPQ